MSKREVTLCDGCGATLQSKKDAYHLNLRTDRFWDGVDTDYLEENLDFCEGCARSIKSSLERLTKEVR